jgi:hypothetical protein
MDKFAFNNGDLAMQYYDNSVPGIDKAGVMRSSSRWPTITSIPP